jgi:hypothetical protein
MKLPNFLIIGAQKSGTTWLAHILSQHDEIFIPLNEIHFFNKENNYKKGLEWYSNHFKKANDNQKIGEKTPNYFSITKKPIRSKYAEHAPFINKKIVETLPNVKIIILLRNPVERAISAINHYRTHGEISPLIDVDDLLLGSKRDLAEQNGTIDMGLYNKHIKSYYEVFNKDQILVQIFEDDIIQNPYLTLKNICKFLDVNPDYNFQKVEEKIGDYSGNGLYLTLGLNYSVTRRLVRLIRKYIPQIMTGPSIKKVRPSESKLDQLYELYSDENDKLFNLIGRRVDSWKKPKMD